MVNLGKVLMELYEWELREKMVKKLQLNFIQKNI
jgi:hypothetical protein